MNKVKNLFKLWLSILNKPFNIAINSLTWSLLNNLFGLLFGSFYILFFQASVEAYQNAFFVKLKKNYSFGLSLGRIIITTTQTPQQLLDHEIGHFKQNLILGPSYLIFIGIPSLFRALIFSLNKKLSYENYFYFYTEAWADELGGIYKLRKHKFDKWWKYLWVHTKDPETSPE